MSLKDIDGQKNRKEWKDIGDLKWTSHEVFNISLKGDRDTFDNGFK